MKKQIVKNIINIFSSFYMKAAGIIGNRGKNSLMCSMCEVYEKSSNEFISFRKRPKFHENMITNYELNGNIDNVCIVLQGPIKRESNFTVETVKFYKSMYPKCTLVVSTWDTEDEDTLELLKKLGAVVIKSQKPKKTGLGNLNFQLVSTKAGVEYASSIEAKYILKTRTDQRIGKNNFLEYLIGLVECFEISDDYLKIGQNSRIVVHQGSTGGNMFIPYFISDFMYFGTSNDIKKLFSLKLDQTISMSYIERAKWLESLCGSISVMDYYKKTAPEMKIVKEYIEKFSGKEPEDSVKEYWEFIKNYLICVSWDDIGLFWYKYNLQNESDIFHLFEERDNRKRYLQYNWTFQNWFNLYMGKIQYIEDFEKIKEEISY